jgi:hypothetical protein
MVLTTSVILPVTLLTTIQLMENDWMVSQQFKKNGKIIFILGFGRDKQEALLDFDYEKGLLENEK